MILNDDDIDKYTMPSLKGNLIFHCVHVHVQNVHESKSKVETCIKYMYMLYQDQVLKLHRFMYMYMHIYFGLHLNFGTTFSFLNGFFRHICTYIYVVHICLNLNPK